jgi:hypothetical protein
MENGVQFKEGILLLANDTQMYSLRYLPPPPVTPNGSILSEPVYRDLIPPANDGLTKNEAQSFSVTRRSLNEDPPIYDVGVWGSYWGKYHVSVWQTPLDDEIHARIYVVSHGIQLPTATADTNEWVLTGPEQAGLVYSSTP